MQRPSGQMAALGLAATGIMLLTYALVRRLTSAPPPGTTSQVMQSVRNSSQVQGIVQSTVGLGSSSGPQCAAACGEPLNFVTGVVRCPNGGITEHRWGPFYHAACVPDDGNCPACQLTLTGVPGYVVNSATTVPVAPPETWTPAMAACWGGCTLRQEGMMCHATAAVAVWQSFGGTKSPRECAHDFAFSIQGRDRYPTYRAQYEKIRATMPSGSTVQQVLDRMSTDSGSAYALSQLTSQFGDPVLTGIGRTIKRLNTVNFTGPDSIRASIDANKLIMAGSHNHWVVICGYSTSTRGGQRVIYYDPSDGATKPDGYVSFMGDKEEFLIVG